MNDVEDFINGYRQQEAETIRHAENVIAQKQIAESNLQVAKEVNGIRESLQVQISDNREQIKESKTTEKKLAKRSWWQFGLSLAVAVGGVVVAIIALFR